MTVETRRTIELTDIDAIEYECRKCGATTVRLLDESHRIPVACGNCATVWTIETSQEHMDLMRFVSLLRYFPKSTANAHVRIKLEVRGIEESVNASGRASGGKD
jgi:hypothetical protein